MSTNRKFIRGTSKLRRQLKRFDPDLRSEIERVMEDVGVMLRDEMQTRAPKDQGDLAENAHYVVAGDKLGVKVGYSRKEGFKRKWTRGGFEAQFQEFGTSRHAAQPFVRPAWRAKIGTALDMIDAARRRTVQRILRAT